MKDIGIALGLAFLAGGGASIHPGHDSPIQPQHDDWETPSQYLPRADDCREIERALIHPVKPASRQQSIAILADDPVFELSDADAAGLFDAPQRREHSLAASLVADSLQKLLARKHRAEVERRDSWSQADERVLVSMSERYAEGEYQGYRPFLVRAVAKHERTGGFYAETCRGDLRIVHGSLGRSTPPSTRVPLIIFLSQQPQRVFATWSIAE